jgi:hypothetical protein
MNHAIVYADTLEQLQFQCEQYLAQGWRIVPGGIVLQPTTRVVSHRQWFGLFDSYEETPCVFAVAILERA